MFRRFVLPSAIVLWVTVAAPADIQQVHDQLNQILGITDGTNGIEILPMDQSQNSHTVVVTNHEGGGTSVYAFSTYQSEGDSSGVGWGGIGFGDGIRGARLPITAQRGLMLVGLTQNLVTVGGVGSARGLHGLVGGWIPRISPFGR